MNFNSALFIAILSEFTGTAILVSLGCLGCVTGTVAEKTHLDMAVSFGFILMICVYVCAPLSGGHVNPWVSTAACILGHLKWDMWLIYFVAQIIGGLFGYTLLYAILPRESFNYDGGLCFARSRERIEDWQVIVAEFMATSVFIFMWAASWDKRGALMNEAFAVRIGFVYLGLVVCVGYFSGASVNLARTLPPSIYHGGWGDAWQPVLSQLLATCLVSVVWRYIFVSPFKEDQTEA